MTSLSRQLSRLRVPQTSVQKERKGSVSFLYDFLEAKSIGNDLHYAIAVSGLQSLIQLEASIERFGETLFNESSKSLDRALQSPEANEDLDTEIEAFLFSVVSKYFLLNSTHKTIEWLIYRYGVNEYNADALIACALPYHETRLFARLLQTCSQPKVKTSKWFWLKQVQISGTPLSKTTLITHCISETDFLRYICDNVLKCVKIDRKNNTFLTFFVSTIINVIERNTNESIISVIIGYAVRGLKSKCDSLRKACLCITAHICTRIELEVNIVDKILKAIDKRIETSFGEEVLIALSVIDRFQHLKDLPQNLIHCLSAKSLIKWSERHSIDNLIGLVLKCLLKNCSQPVINDKLMTLLDELTLSSQSIDSCIQTIAARLDSKEPAIPIDNYSKVISLLEKRYSVLLDASLSKLSSMSSIAPFLGAFRYSFLKDSKIPLIFGLCHTNQSIQKEAIDHLIENFDVMTAQRDEFTISMIKSLLLDAFSLKTPQILILIFGLKERMFEIFSEEEMREISQKLLNFCSIKEEDSDEDNRMSWHQLKNSILATYCSIEANNNESFYSFIFPYLLPLSESDLVTLSIVLNSKSIKTIEVLAVLWEKCKKHIESNAEENDFNSIAAIVCTQMAHFYIKNPDLILEKSFIHNNHQNILHLKSCSLSVVILERILVLSSDADTRLRSANILLNLIESMLKTMKVSKSKHSFESFEEFLSNYLENLSRNRITLSNIIFAINSVINSIDTSIGQQFQSNIWFGFKQLKCNYIYKLFFLLFNNCYDKNKSKSIAFRKTSVRLIEKISSVISFDYFAPIWANSENLLWQSRSLAVSSHLSQTAVPFSPITVMSSLIAMHSPLSNCRQLALVVAKHLNQLLKNQLLRHCLENSESIINDESFVSHVIANWFSSKPKGKAEKSLIESTREEWIVILNDDNTPENVKSGLILLLNKCDNDLLTQVLTQTKSYLNILSPNRSQMKTIDSLLSIYSEDHIFQNSSSEKDLIFSFFINLIQSKYSQEIALNLINRQLFNSIPVNNMRIYLLNELLDIIVVKSAKTANKKLKKLLKTGDLISDLLQFLIPTNDSNNYCEPKAKRMFVNDSQFSLESNQWKKFIVLLETINSKSNLTQVSSLVKDLFDYLKMTFIMESKSSLEYLRQLLLSSLINCMKDSCHELSSVQIDSVIECLRESQQKETQKMALILISSVAHRFRKEILDYIIPIFTFIGTNLLQCDDQYSIQVVSDTMEAILPILLTDTSAETKDKVINLFMDSLPDIPAHRRLHLFQKLLDILGQKQYLATFFMKVVERMYNKPKLQKEPFLCLIVALTSGCEINSQIESLNKIMNVFADELTEKRSEVSIMSHFTDTHRNLITQSLAQIILRIISSQEFIQTTINSEWNQISDEMLEFLHRLIVLIDKYSLSGSESSVKDSNSFRKRIRSLFYQILLQFNSILPNEQLVELVLQLFQNDSQLIRRKALELLNEKLTQLSNQTLNSQQMINLCQSLASMVPSAEEVNQMKEQHIYNTQLSMITLKLLSKHIGDSDEMQQIILNLTKDIISLITGMKAEVSVNFKASAILCLTQLTICLGNKSIPLIPSIIPILLNNFDIRDEVIIISNITSISKIAQSFPQFLSPYLDQIIIKLLNSCNNCPQIKSKLKSIWNCFAKTIPKRVLLSCIDSSYSEVSKLSLESLCELMFLLKLTLEDISTKGEVQNIQKFVKNILLKALDFRNLNRNVDLTEISKFENSCNESICVFIPKMTEITFRPLFYKLYDWAIREKSGKLYYRMISMYRLLDVLADRLKSLFCIFIAPSIVNNCSQMLSLFHSDNESDLTLDPKTSHSLIISILSTISKCFLYDINGAFLNKDRMQALAKPIVNQLTNTLGTDEEYNERVNTLCLCSQYLIESNKDETVIKEFNYQILLKTRESSTHVRFGALRVLHRVILVCGEDYLPIIPETIPFISELSEDDSNDIEELVKTVVTDLEQILGEPITKYL